MANKQRKDACDAPPVIVLRWAGATREDGTPQRFFRGTPARDLTTTDLAGLAPERITQLTASGLYADAGTSGNADHTQSAPPDGDKE